MTVSPTPAPRIDPTVARRRIDAFDQPFVFYADESTGRGKVLYHRYDGHYGLITPRRVIPIPQEPDHGPAPLTEVPDHRPPPSRP
ncbi:sigma 54 modulation/S30EA ribosomal C-terminal domain-containing protein [Kitasatospora sp. NPDC001159]